MTNYRLYFLDGFSGHVDRAEYLSARDDGEALAMVGKLPRAQPIELWHQGHKILRLEASERGTAPARVVPILLLVSDVRHRRSGAA